MKPDQKKKWEASMLDAARRLRPDLYPSGHSQDSDGENPDIVVYCDGWGYGVEVTDIISQEEKAQEDVRRKVCELAQDLANLPHGYDVAVCFRRDKFIGGRDVRSAIAGQIAASVREADQEHADDDRWKTRIRLWSGPLSNWATDVFVYRIPDVVTTWRSQEGWGVGPLLPAEVRRRLLAKERRLHDYRLRTPRVLLLLVIPGYLGSGSSYVPPLTRQAEYQTDFDGVALLDLLNADVIELDIAPLGADSSLGK